MQISSKVTCESDSSKRSFFDDWLRPTLLTILFFVLNFVWIFANYFIFPKKPCTLEEYWKHFSLLYHTNKVLGYTSLQILAFVYFAATAASIYQLIDSAKSKKFPKYLEFWMRTRKQFGLLAFWLSSVHVLTTVYIMNPLYFYDWLRRPDSIESLFRVKGHLAMVFGLFSYALMALVALSSTNSVRKCLTFDQWLCVQSNFGILCLVFGAFHSFVMYYNIFSRREELNSTTSYLLSRTKLIACYFPLIVLLSRLALGYFPPIANKLNRIRQNVISEKKRENSNFKSD